MSTVVALLDSRCWHQRLSSQLTTAGPYGPPPADSSWEYRPPPASDDRSLPLTSASCCTTPTRHAWCRDLLFAPLCWPILIITVSPPSYLSIFAVWPSFPLVESISSTLIEGRRLMAVLLLLPLWGARALSPPRCWVPPSSFYFYARVKCTTVPASFTHDKVLI
jgi:hypothetical protein